MTFITPPRVAAIAIAAIALMCCSWLTLATHLAVTVAVVVVLGIPPYGDIARFYHDTYHPVAREIKIVRTINEAQCLFAITAGIELGLFDAMKAAGRSMTVDAIAIAIGAPVRGVAALVDALCASQYVISHGDGRYSNSASAACHLTSGVDEESDMKHIVLLFGGRDMTRIMSTTTEAVRNGGAVGEHAGNPDHSFWLRFAEVTGNLATVNAKGMIKGAGYAFPKGCRVLDVASGSGQYGCEVLRAVHDSTCVLQDFPAVLDVAKKAIFLPGASFLPGDFFEIDITTVGMFDTVVVANLWHHLSPEQIGIFLKRAAMVTKKGGYLVVVEICPPSGPYSLFEEGASTQRTFSHVMLTWSKEGKAYREPEIKEIVDTSGMYTNVQTFQVVLVSTILTAQRI